MKTFSLFFWMAVIPFSGLAQFWLEGEGGMVFTGYNDARITGSSGTFFSFPDDLGGDPHPFMRLRAGLFLGEKSEVLLLYAPLRFNYKGSFDRAIDFKGEEYIGGMPVEGIYIFNSYRATYRYYIRRGGQMDVAFGLTVKVRDAMIALDGGGVRTERTDLGAVPLINLHLHWKPGNNLGVLLDGDALAAPSGRAADLMLAATYKLSQYVSLHAGYRILEGGADNAKVYTFSLFHYGLAGLRLSL